MAFVDNTGYYDRFWAKMNQDVWSDEYIKSTYEGSVHVSETTDSKLSKYPFGVDELVLIDGIYQIKK